MEYPIIRSKRKTVAIVVSRDGEVEIRAPLRLPAGEIEQFVRSRQGWIDEHQAQKREAARKRAAFAPMVGGAALFLGTEYPIRAGSPARFDGEAFRVPEDREARAGLISIYRKLAREELSRRTAEFAARLGVVPTGLRITSASTRYGSCSGKNSLSFTWKLVMAPPGAVDYVVVHELCHIREHNHSPRFWGEVARWLPDYREREAVLRQFGRLLQEQDWAES